MRQRLLMLLIVCSIHALAQDIAIRDIDYRSDYYLSETLDKNFRIVYKVKSKNQVQSLFRKIDFDSLLRLSDTTEIKLNGNFKLVASAEGSRYVASALGSKDTGVLQLHWLDKETEEQSATRIFTTGTFSKRMAVRVHPSSDPEAFFVIYSVNKQQWDVLLLSRDGKVKTKRTINSGGKRLAVAQSYFINGDLVLIINKNHASKASAYETLILDGLTGKDKANQILSSKDARLEIDNSFIVDSTLYLAGRKFFSNRIKHNQPGMPSLVSVDPLSDSIRDSRLNIASIPNNVFWMDVVKLPDGNKYLVGETFTSEPFGAYFAKALVTSFATLGMFSVTWSSLKWKDVVVLPLDADNTKPLYCTIAQRRVQIGSHLPAYPFASYAHRTGQIRYFGHSSDGYLYLLDGGVFKKYTPDLKRFTTLGQLPAPDNAVVLTTKDTNAVVATRAMGALNIVVFRFVDVDPDKRKNR